MPKSNYGRFSDGVQISGVCLNVHQKGVVRYVCNSTTVAPSGVAGSDGSDGKTPDRPLASITQALSLCVAGRGDKIVLLPGHAETVSAASGININVAGVEIVCDPNAVGSQRPTITLGTANTATVAVTAKDVVINGVLFVANFLNIAACVVVTAATDVQLVNCEWRDTSAILNFVKAVKTDSTDNDCDGLTVKNCQMNATGTTAATTLVNAAGANARMVVEDNVVNIQGTTATTGGLILATSKALTFLSCQRNVLNSPLTTSAAGALIVAGSSGSGIVADNYVYCPAASTAILCTTGTGLGFKNNFVSRSAVDTSGLLLPAASS